MKIAILVGSLRKESFNRKIANTIIEMAPASMKIEIVEIGKLAFYNEDYEDETPPESWVEFRKAIKAADGILFITPEYNRSTTAVIKNAIDVGSRPYDKNVWTGKPAAVISVSIGAQGGFGANHHLRQSLVFVNCPTMQQPEMYIGKVKELFNDKGTLTNASTKKFLEAFLAAYSKWVNKLI